MPIGTLDPLAEPIVAMLVGAIQWFGGNVRFCFVHAADLHLDTPFSGIGEAAPEVSDALRRASLDAFDGLIDLAIEREAAFVVFAAYQGDGRSIYEKAA